MTPSRVRALSLAVAVTAWSGVVAPRLPTRWRVPVQAILGGMAACSVRARFGLRPPALGDGLRTGFAVVGVVSAAVVAATGLPPVRRAMNERELPRPAVGWLLVSIPVGTVWSEEAAFRAGLGTVAAQAFGPRLGRLVQAAVFGLSHVADARGADEPVVGTVFVTGAAGWLFGWLYDRTGSLAAPMLGHLAVNEAGAVAALVVQSQTRRSSITGNRPGPVTD